MSKRNIGSKFDDFLAEEGLLQEATAVAVKRYIDLTPRTIPAVH